MDREEMIDHPSQQAVPEMDATIEGLGADFTPEEQQVLESLAARYQQCLDMFSAREIERLRFMRWLYQNGCFPRPRDARNRSRRAGQPRKASAQPDTQPNTEPTL